MSKCCCDEKVFVEVPKEWEACMTSEEKDAWLYNMVRELYQRGQGAIPIITADATVDDSVGNPMVEVVKSGTDTVPNFLFNFSGIKGEKGDKGAAGPQGVQGEIGPQGPQGEQGITPNISVDATVANTTGTPTVEVVKTDEITGSKYTLNFSGLKGETGATGPQGVQGEIGPQGPQGATGPQGIQGIAGPRGPVGATGSQGPKGDTGAQGIQGATGPQGPRGYTGTKGDTGATGPQGPAGPQGVAGPQGEPGPIPNMVFSTETTQSTGEANVDVETTKVEDTYSVTLKFSGIKGETGPQGETGAAGPQGPQGVQGEIGPQGPQGLQGEIGPQGPQGEPGVQGTTPNITVNATVDNTTGTPAVTVEKSGTETDPIFSLNFTGLKGKSGTSILATFKMPTDFPVSVLFTDGTTENCNCNIGQGGNELIRLSATSQENANRYSILPTFKNITITRPNGTASAQNSMTIFGTFYAGTNQALLNIMPMVNLFKDKTVSQIYATVDQAK